MTIAMKVCTILAKARLMADVFKDWDPNIMMA